MQYELAALTDINQLIAMRLAYIASDQGQITDNDLEMMRKQLPAYFTAHLGKDLFAFVAKDAQEIVATALLLVVEKPSNPHFIHGQIGEVLNVYTKESYRHLGIATALMKQLLSFSKSCNLDYVTLKATPAGYPLYKALGFTESASPYISMKY